MRKKPRHQQIRHRPKKQSLIKNKSYCQNIAASKNANTINKVTSALVTLVFWKVGVFQCSEEFATLTGFSCHVDFERQIHKSKKRVICSICRHFIISANGIAISMLQNWKMIRENFHFIICTSSFQVHMTATSIMCLQHPFLLLLVRHFLSLAFSAKFSQSRPKAFVSLVVSPTPRPYIILKHLNINTMVFLGCKLLMRVKSSYEKQKQNCNASTSVTSHMCAPSSPT